MKTTIYLPDDLKEEIEKAAAREGRTEAEIIREAVAEAMQKRKRPLPRVPLTGRDLGDRGIAERVDELLEGFGR